jgi:hypothetical protein
MSVEFSMKIPDGKAVPQVSQIARTAGIEAATIF